jgi:hypothetical protein
LQPDWNTPAGRALTALSTAILKQGLVLQHPIIVFGSAPLQICVDPGFLSADVDVSLPGQGAALKKLVEEIGMSKENAAYYIEVVPEYIFRPGPNWRARAMPVSQNGVGFLLPDPLDILLAKLRRLEEKDIRAFQLVLEKTGRPSEQELVRELQASYDLFYFQKDGRKSALWVNTEKLWPRIYGHEIDVQAQIIQPVLDQLAESGASPDYLEEIRRQLGLYPL